MPDIEIDEMSTRIEIADEQSQLDPALVARVVDEVAALTGGEEVTPDGDSALPVDQDATESEDGV